jgi:hypothetical protein
MGALNSFEENLTHKCCKNIIGLSLGAKKEFVGKEIVQVSSIGFKNFPS